MTYLLTIDPGETTGVALGFYSPKAAYEPIWVRAIHDGALGFYEWWHDEAPNPAKRGIATERVYETYVPHGVQNPVALEVIGVVKALRRHGFRITGTQRPSDKSQCPDSVLREHGLWMTGKQVNHTDARDVNDAIIHGITYCKLAGHGPTLERYFPEL